MSGYPQQNQLPEAPASKRPVSAENRLHFLFLHLKPSGQRLAVQAKRFQAQI